MNVSLLTTRIGFLALLGAACSTWITALVTSCGGADSYGYVSASRLLRTLRLFEPEPLAALVPSLDGLNALAPLGWMPAPGRDALVPTYPLGLPIVMAFFAAVFGNGAEFYVSPVLAGLALLVAYRIGLAFSDGTGGMLSALLLAVTPIFVQQAIQPMSDVAATFWILLAWWLLVDRTDGPLLRLLAAATAAGMAFLTRPVLLPAIVVLGIVAFAWRGARGAVVFAAGFFPFLAMQAWLQWRLFGSVLTSGYGPASHLFVPARAAANVVTYVRWLNYSLSPLFLLTVVGGAFVRESRPLWVASAALFAGASAPYLFYFTYDDWQDTRFLLPGMAALVVASAVTVRTIAARWVRPAIARLATLVVACAAAAASYQFLDRHHTFALARIEAKYPRVADWIEQSSPPHTAVFAFLHSGSVRHYAGRPTVRWDLLPGEDLSAAVAALNSRGWETWAVIDGPDEAAAFWPKIDAVEDSLAFEPKGRIQGVDIVALRTR